MVFRNTKGIWECNLSSPFIHLNTESNIFNQTFSIKHFQCTGIPCYNLTTETIRRQFNNKVCIINCSIPITLSLSSDFMEYFTQFPRLHFIRSSSFYRDLWFLSLLLKRQSLQLKFHLYTHTLNSTNKTNKQTNKQTKKQQQKRNNYCCILSN